MGIVSFETYYIINNVYVFCKVLIHELFYDFKDNFLCDVMQNERDIKNKKIIFEKLDTQM